MLLFLVLSSLFSSSETAFLSVNRYRLTVKAREGNKKAAGIKKLLEDIENFLSTILIGNTIANTALASIITYIFSDYVMKGKGENVVFWATLTSTVLILIFSEMLPKTVAANYPEQLSSRTYPFIKFFYVFLKPLSYGFTGIIRGFMKLMGLRRGVMFPSLTREEIKTMVLSRGGTERDFIMLRRLFMLEEKRAGDIMIPRVKIVAIKEEASYEEIMETFRKHRYSRYPIYRNRIDQVTGILNIKDVISAVEKEKIKAKDLAREANFIPVYSKLSEIFQFMRKERVHLALIVDEYGSLRGLITLEDIIEEVMGEIWDEHEVFRRESKIEPVSENLYLIDGEAEIGDVEEALGIKLPREGYSTFAGFVFKIMERVPKEGESFEFGNWYFRIKKMTRNTIVEVEARRRDENSGNQQES